MTTQVPLASGTAESCFSALDRFPQFRTLNAAFDYMERVELGSKVKAQFGEYLQERFVFTHFVTLTLRDRKPRLDKLPAGRVSLNRAWRGFRKLVQAENVGIAPAGVRVIEYQRRGVPHIHSLTVNTVGIIGTEREIESDLWTSYGRSQIHRYNPHFGASGYLSKYLVKDARVEISAYGRLHHYQRPDHLVIPTDSIAHSGSESPMRRSKE